MSRTVTITSDSNDLSRSRLRDAGDDPAHARTNSLPLLAVTKPLNTSLT